MGLTEAMRAVDATVRFEIRRVEGGFAPLPPAPALSGRTRLVDEAGSKAALAAHGMTLPPSGAAASAGEAARLATEVGFPVALKVLDPILAHKTKAGGVALALASAEEVASAWDRMAETFAASGTPLKHALVERMILDRRAELIVGGACIPRFGHALVLGYGGVDAEALDIADTLLLPADERASSRFVDRARAARGLSPEARTRIACAVCAVAAYVDRERSRLLALDINPLILGSNGEVTVADALIQLCEEAPP